MLTNKAERLLRYVVRLKSTAGDKDVDTLCAQLENAEASCAFKYSSVFTGFAAEVSQKQHSPWRMTRLQIQSVFAIVCVCQGLCLP